MSKNLYTLHFEGYTMDNYLTQIFPSTPTIRVPCNRYSSESYAQTEVIPMKHLLPDLMSLLRTDMGTLDTVPPPPVSLHRHRW